MKSCSETQALEPQPMGYPGASTPIGQWAATTMSLPSAWPLSSSAHQPVIPLLVERDVPVAVVPRFVVALGVVQHEDPDRHLRFGLEGVAGKAGRRVGLGEAVSLRTRRGLEEFAHPLALRQRTAVGVGGEHFRRRGEVGDRSQTEDVAMGRAAVEAAHVDAAAVGTERVFEDVAEIEDLVADIGLAQVVVDHQEARPEVVVIAARLVPGDRLVETRRLVGAQELGPRSAGAIAVDAGIGVDGLAVDDVEVPAQLVVLGVVAGVAQGDAKVDRLLFVHGVDRLQRGVQDVVRVHHDARIGRREEAFVAEEDGLGGRLHVGDVDVGDGEEAQESGGRRGHGAAIVGRHEVEPPHAIETRPVAPLAIAVVLVLGKLKGEHLLGIGGDGVGHDRLVECRRDRGSCRVAFAYWVH